MDGADKQLTLLIIESQSLRLQEFIQSLNKELNIIAMDVDDEMEGSKNSVDPDCILMDTTTFDQKGLLYLQYLSNSFPNNKAIFLANSKELELNDKLSLMSFRPAGEIGRDSIRNFQRLIQQAMKGEPATHHDELTQLPDRLYFKAIFKREITRCKKEGSLLALLTIGMDRFKTVNDRLGHPFGDLLLKQISDRLKSVVDEKIFVSRLGGDEFALLLTELNKEIDAGLLASKILKAIGEPYTVQGHEITLSASIGIAVYPWTGNNPYILAKHAGIALYHAKKLGGNQYEYFTLNLKDTSQTKLLVESELKSALSKNQFYLKYQPIYRLPDLKVVGAEALLRWRHPKFSSMNILEVINIAEDMGLILPLGEWIARTAIAFQKKWKKITGEEKLISINLSAAQISKTDFTKFVMDVCDENDVKSTSIIIELTETMVMENPEQSTNKLLRLRNKNFNVAIDDFGTGLSSLNYIKNLPINIIKIDKAFISDIQSEEDSKIIKKIIELAKDINLSIIAEGVETKDQLNFLIKLECDYVQGFYLSRPIGENLLLELEV